MTVEAHNYLHGCDVLGDAYEPMQVKLPRLETVAIIVGSLASVATLIEFSFRMKGGK